MTQRNQAMPNETPSPVSDQRVSQLLNNPEVQAVAERPDNQQRIETHFEQRSTRLRSKLGAAWDDLRDAYRMSFDKGFNLEPKVRGVLLVALLYLVVPVDLIPDPIPVLGVADDVALIIYAIRLAKPEITRYRALIAERNQGKTLT